MIDRRAASRHRRLMAVAATSRARQALAPRSCLHVPLELGEGRPLGRVEHLAAELDRDLRRVALHAREQRRLDALQLLGRLVAPSARAGRRAARRSRRQQDAEEGADERRADHARRAPPAAGRPSPSCCTTPSTAATMPNAGRPPARRASACAGTCPRGDGSRSRCPSGSRSRARSGCPRPSCAGSR